MSQFLHHTDNANAKAIAISLVFSENSRAKNSGSKHSYPVFIKRAIFGKSNAHSYRHCIPIVMTTQNALTKKNALE